MVGVFAIFGTLSSLELKQAGVGLATAVLIDATAWQPAQCPLEVPVPLAEQLHRRRQQDARTIVASIRTAVGEADARLLDLERRKRAEEREDADHHERGARDHAGRDGDAVPHGLVGRMPSSTASRTRLRMNTW